MPTPRATPNRRTHLPLRSAAPPCRLSDTVLHGRPSGAGWPPRDSGEWSEASAGYWPLAGRLGLPSTGHNAAWRRGRRPARSHRPGSHRPDPRRVHGPIVDRGATGRQKSAGQRKVGAGRPSPPGNFGRHRPTGKTGCRCISRLINLWTSHRSADSQAARERSTASPFRPSRPPLSPVSIPEGYPRIFCPVSTHHRPSPDRPKGINR